MDEDVEVPVAAPSPRASRRAFLPLYLSVLALTCPPSQPILQPPPNPVHAAPSPLPPPPAAQPARPLSPRPAPPPPPPPCPPPPPTPPPTPLQPATALPHPTPPASLRPPSLPPSAVPAPSSPNALPATRNTVGEIPRAGPPILPCRKRRRCQGSRVPRRIGGSRLWKPRRSTRRTWRASRRIRLITPCLRIGPTRRLSKGRGWRCREGSVRCVPPFIVDIIIPL